MHKFFADLFEGFHALHMEIEQQLGELPEEALDWQPGPGMNSVNVLMTHLFGAERYWIGDVARGESSHRDRDAEFEAKGLDKAALVRRLKELDAYVAAALGSLELADLEQPRRSRLDGHKCTVGWALTHALEHSATHVGHLQLMSQLWQQKSGKA